MEIKSLITEEFLKRFRVFNPSSLFDPTPWEIKYYLLKEKCPICLHKLYWRRDKKIAYCKSRRKDGYIITKDKFVQLTGKLITPPIDY